MAGRTLNLFDFTDFSFKSLDTGGSTTVWLRQYAPASAFLSGHLVVAMRSVDIADMGSVVSFALEPVAVRWDDPGTFYRDPKESFPATDLKVLGPLVGEGMLFREELGVGRPLANLVSLRMSVTQGLLGSTLSFTVAVSLELKDW